MVSDEAGWSPSPVRSIDSTSVKGDLNAEEGGANAGFWNGDLFEFGFGVTVGARMYEFWSD